MAKKKRETRGFTDEEPLVIKSFWDRNNMDDMLQLSGEELDTKVDNFLDDYEIRQVKQTKFWEWPNIPKKYIDRWMK